MPKGFLGCTKLVDSSREAARNSQCPGEHLERDNLALRLGLSDSQITGLNPLQPAPGALLSRMDTTPTVMNPHSLL